MGCCLFVIISAVWPRLVLLLLWFFEPAFFAKAFTNWVLPIIGFIILPTTTLAYIITKSMAAGGQVHGLWIGVIGLALLHDLAHISAASRTAARGR